MCHTSIEILYLPLRELTGTIPTELGRMASLSTYVRVRVPLFLLEIDHRVSRRLSVSVVLHGSFMTGTIPSELVTLPSLGKFVAGRIRLLSVSSTVALCLHCFVVLRLQRTFCSEAADCRVASLTRLARLPNLVSLNISLMSCRTILSLTMRRIVATLTLSDAPLEGSIPTEIGRLTNLGRSY